MSRYNINFKITHGVRSYTLRLQALWRKYIKLPIFILVKNSVRAILLQPSEWEYDWGQWRKEQYIYCDLEGKPYVDLKKFNLMDKEFIQTLTMSLQIQIKSPFHITPWTNSNSNYLIDIDNSPIFLGIWGEEMELPSKN